MLAMPVKLELEAVFNPLNPTDGADDWWRAHLQVVVSAPGAMPFKVLVETQPGADPRVAVGEALKKAAEQLLRPPFEKF
ncbi:MAG: hypothetical protein Q8L48_16845 [Archangium sp.]|nr:hypothetical protein [Archangium sp.]